MLHVTCHVSCVTCHVSHVTFFFFFWAEWWSLSVEGLSSTGLPRLVSIEVVVTMLTLKSAICQTSFFFLFCCRNSSLLQRFLFSVEGLGFFAQQRAEARCFQTIVLYNRECFLGKTFLFNFNVIGELRLWSVDLSYHHLAVGVTIFMRYVILRVSVMDSQMFVRYK